MAKSKATKNTKPKPKPKPAPPAKPKPKSPPPPPPPPPRARGSARMRQMGLRQVVVWFDEIEMSQVEKAAANSGKKLATWVRERSYQAAMVELYPTKALDSVPGQD